MFLDWHPSYVPHVTDKNIQAGIKGLLYNEDLGEIEPSMAPPTNMPSYNSNSTQAFQLFLSDYTLDSFGTSFLRAFPVNISLESKNVMPESPIQLDTTSLSYFFWGMEYHYG